jgi:hypothetical protein
MLSVVPSLSQSNFLRIQSSTPTLRKHDLHIRLCVRPAILPGQAHHLSRSTRTLDPHKPHSQFDFGFLQRRHFQVTPATGKTRPVHISAQPSTSNPVVSNRQDKSHSLELALPDSTTLRHERFRRRRCYRRRSKQHTHRAHQFCRSRQATRENNINGRTIDRRRIGTETA